MCSWEFDRAPACQVRARLAVDEPVLPTSTPYLQARSLFYPCLDIAEAVAIIPLQRVAS